MKTAARAMTKFGLAALAAATSGCAWVGLGWGALTYPTTQPGEAANVAAGAAHAYVTRGPAGLEVLDLATARSTLQPLPPGLDSADDVAVADGLLFVLDARPPGHLAVFSLADPAAPALLGAPVPVDVGPFSGVAAAGGRVVVSGGTSLLELRSYDAAGRLSERLATADLGRGQPDVLLAPDGALAFVSTHAWGPHFSLEVARLAVAPPAIARAGALDVATYGFTPGGAKPANFPLESALAGATLYVASAASLTVIDVRDDDHPTLLAQLDPGVQPVNVDVRDGVAALVGSAPAPQLVLVDVRDAARPKVLQSFPLPKGSRATGVALTPSRVIVAAHARGSLLLDRPSGAWEQIQPTSPSSSNQGAVP